MGDRFTAVNLWETQHGGCLDMETARFEHWVERYVRAWNSNDPEDIGALFAEDGRYRTEPYAEPWQGREEIVREWLGIKDEPGQTEFTYGVIATEGELGIVKGETIYKEPRGRYSNLWEIRLDAEGRCTEYVEWWMKQP